MFKWSMGNNNFEAAAPPTKNMYTVLDMDSRNAIGGNSSSNTGSGGYGGNKNKDSYKGSMERDRFGNFYDFFFLLFFLPSKFFAIFLNPLSWIPI